MLSWLLGSVRWELVFDGPWDGPDEDRSQSWWERIVFECHAQKSTDRLPRLSVSMRYHGANWFT